MVAAKLIKMFLDQFSICLILFLIGALFPQIEGWNMWAPGSARQGSFKMLDYIRPPCPTFHGSPVSCRLTGCFYCCSDDICYTNRNDAANCELGCPNFCSDGVQCATHGCHYNDETQECEGRAQCDTIHPTRTNECIEAGCNYCCTNSVCQDEPADGCWNLTTVATKPKRYLKDKIISFYPHSEYGGPPAIVQGFTICDQCRNLPTNLTDVMSSIKTYGECVTLYSENDCKGDQRTAKTDVFDFVTQWGRRFNDVVNSMKIC